MNGLIDPLPGQGGTVNGDGYRVEPVALLENDKILRADLKIAIVGICSRYIILVQNLCWNGHGATVRQVKGKRPYTRSLTRTIVPGFAVPTLMYAP
ncbi:hypothetical protein AY600_18910 [Phormidium willei BDU 130791]|nr:hypothetical protein AY600_18910 [Phormidium willei BDU 130791]